MIKTIPFLLCAVLTASIGCASDPPAAAPAEQAWARHDSAATLAFRSGRLDSAAALLQQALNAAQAFDSDDERRLKTLRQMAYLANVQGYPARAESLYTRLLDIQKTYRNENDPHLLETLDQLATLYAEGQQHARAESLYTRIFSLQEPDLEAGSIQAASTLDKLAGLYSAQNRFGLADSTGKRALALKIYAQAYDHYINKQYDQAESLYRKALTIQQTKLGPTHPDLALTAFQLALLYDNQRKDRQAAALYRQALGIRTANLGPDHRDVAIIQAHLDEVTARLD